MNKEKEIEIKKLEEKWNYLSSDSKTDSYIGYIAYVDILGYHELIKDRGLIEICKLIEKARIDVLLKQLKQSNVEKFKDVLYSGPHPSESKSSEDGFYKIKAIAFSDNILLSTPSNWSLLLRVVIGMQAALIQEGIFIRGAMVHGEIYHSDTLVGGDGLIRAYHIESKVAVYPRIIVDQSYIKAARTASQHLVGNNERIMYYLKPDFDNNYFLDYLKMDNQTFKDTHKRKVDEAIEKNKFRFKVLEKFIWCKTYHEESMCQDNS